GQKSTWSVGSGEGIEPTGNGNRYVDRKTKVTQAYVTNNTSARQTRVHGNRDYDNTTGGFRRTVRREPETSTNRSAKHGGTWNVLKSGPFCTQSPSLSPAGRGCAVAG
ncbi:unnamed protein product, partial [Ectocarpus sp. 8 AP-2014]